MPGTIRTFIAIDVPDGVKRMIADAQDQLKRVHGAKLSLPRREGIHLTLKFLGDVEHRRLDDVVQAVRDPVLTVKQSMPDHPFELRTGHTGGFPNLRNPRVLWLGVDGGEMLNLLHQRIDENLGDIGFPAERKRFHPHLTVARVKWMDSGSELTRRFERIELPEERWTAYDVRVMSSELHPRGAIYRVTASISLL